MSRRQWRVSKSGNIMTQTSQPKGAMSFKSNHQKAVESVARGQQATDDKFSNDSSFSRLSNDEYNDNIQNDSIYAAFK